MEVEMDLLQPVVGHSNYLNQIGLSPELVQISVKERVPQTPKPKKPSN